MSLARSLAATALLATAAWSAPTAGATPRTIRVEVTREGFVPAEITVKRGEPVKLEVTRKVERTCATEIVAKELGIDQPLPMGKPVTVAIAPQKPGAYRFGCAMGMITGVLKVE